MSESSPSRRTGLARRRPATGAPTLVEREAAVLASEREAHLRGQAVDRRERSADRREAASTLRERALESREAAARAAAGARVQATARLRKVNERLVLATVDAQTRIEAAEQVTAAMCRAAQHDCLTGLPNRSLLAERLEQAMASARLQGHRVALLFLDLDHFKEVNDTLGHPAGDLLLQSSARRLQACVSLGDTVCRQGGDEFVLLLAEVAEAEDAILAAGKVLAAMAPAHLLGGRQVPVTVSIGISLFPDHGADGEALLEAADIAMYQAKRFGRNNFQIFTRPPHKAAGRGRQRGRAS